MKQTKKVLENHIINGSANLNYNLQQFRNLTDEQKVKFIWFAAVQKGINNDILHSDIKPETFDFYFGLVNSAKNLYDANIKSLNIDKYEVGSAAQGMTLIAYGEIFNIPFRSLDYNCKCNDFQDFRKCLKLINSYNEYDYSEMKKHIYNYLDKHKFYSEWNPNNGLPLFSYYIARESSPCFYVEFSDYLSSNVIVNREGAEVEYCNYSTDDFKKEMSILSQLIKADEFSIKEKKYPLGEASILTARFWFD